MLASPLKRDTLLDFFADVARTHGEFLIHDDGLVTRTFTYAQIAKASHAFAAKLQAVNINSGDKVLVWSENRPEWIAALWGCLIAGAIAVPIDYRSSAGYLSRIAQITGARLLLTGDLTDTSGLNITAWRLADIARSEPGQPRPTAGIEANTTAEILFTSGATAEPKGVIITHRNILANIVPVEREILKYNKHVRWFAPLRILNLLPLSHMFGQAMAAFIPPMLPAAVIFMNGYNPHEIVRQIRSRRASVLVSVPKILEVLREHILALAPEAAEPPPSGARWWSNWWRYRRVHRIFGWKFWSFVVGAAPLPQDLEEFWSRLGYVVIQGYGLTETAPIVTLNHPFRKRKGTVGTPIAGVEMKLAPDGEVLVRGGNVTSGYLNAPNEEVFDAEGWFHTGDIGALDEAGSLVIRGRKKEMIVTPDGLNIFPEDVENALNHIGGVRDSAVVGIDEGGTERVHAALVLAPEADPEAVIRQANSQLEDHQKVRSYTVWHDADLPRTEGTRKLKRREIRAAIQSHGAADRPANSAPAVESVVARYAPGREITSATTLEQLGLSSLERVELLTALERTFDRTIDEASFAACATVADLKRLIETPAATLPASAIAESVPFPSWNRSKLALCVRRVNLPVWILPLARIFAQIRTEGREHLARLEPPLIFAANHQSHLDVPVILSAMPSKWRYRIAPAMSKEFFRAHFFPEQHSWSEVFTNRLNYHLGALVFNAFPLPQREAGARQTLRYAGELASDGWCILIFPEGKITDTGELAPFQPGVAMMASKLRIPVVPVRIDGLEKVLHRTWRFPRPGRVRVRFGAALHLEGEDYPALAREVQHAIERLA